MRKSKASALTALIVSSTLSFANTLDRLAANFANPGKSETKIDFRSVDQANGHNFEISPKILNSGSGQLWGMVYSKEEFLDSRERAKIERLDDIVSNILDDGDYQTLVATKQAYLLKNVQVSDFKEGYEIFRDPEYSYATNPDQKLIFPKEPANYHWLVILKLPIPWLLKPIVSAMFTIRDVLAHVHHIKIKPDQEMDRTTLDTIASLDPDVGIPKLVAITYSNRTFLPSSKDSKEPSSQPHNYYRGSLSYTSYYPVNNDRDLLVITYQVVKINISIPSYLRGQGEPFYKSGTEQSVCSTRRYFAKKKG